MGNRVTCAAPVCCAPLLLLPAAILILWRVQQTRADMYRELCGMLDHILQTQHELYSAYLRAKHDEEKSRLYLLRCMEKGDYTPAISYLHRKHSPNRTVPPATGMPNLDLLVEWYRVKLKERGQNLTVSGRLQKLPVRETDFCILLCNLMEYILHESMLCPDEGGQVQVNIRQQGEMLYLSVCAGLFARTRGIACWKHVRRILRMHKQTAMARKMAMRHGGRMRFCAAEGQYCIRVVFWGAAA